MRCHLIIFIQSRNFPQSKDLTDFELVKNLDCNKVNKQDSHTTSFPSQTNKNFFLGRNLSLTRTQGSNNRLHLVNLIFWDFL